jgi:nucleoside-diphosphate-sugar epimerase
VGGEVFNIATNGRVSLNDLLATLNKILATDLQPLHGPARAGDVRHSQADISKAGRLLGYKPVVSFEDGLRKTVEWFRASAT